jgi:hypothetical protein
MSYLSGRSVGPLAGLPTGPLDGYGIGSRPAEDRLGAFTPIWVTDDMLKDKKEACIAKCSDLTLPTKDYGITFFRCMQHCMGEQFWPQFAPHF